MEEFNEFARILSNKLGGWVVVHNFDLITGGRIAVCWNPQVVDMQIVCRAEQFIHSIAQNRITHKEIQLTFAYGLYTVVARRPLWDALRLIGNGMNQPWLCMGDFNAYLKITDKIGGPPITGYMVRDFEECCVRNGLVDLSYTGFQYTWSNGRTWCKLDRALVNQEWGDASFSSTAEFLAPGAHSDHSPCVVSITEQDTIVARPFRYYNMWSGHPDFQQIVNEVWSEEILGTKQYVLCKKLKLLKSPLKQLNKRAFGHISQKAESARTELDNLQKLLHDDPNNEEVRSLTQNAKARVLFLDQAEKSFYYQKAKCNYIREGDRSTRFFHSLCKRNANKNRVATILKTDGTFTSTTDEIFEEFERFYRDLLGTRSTCRDLDESVIQNGPRVSAEVHDQLIGAVSDEEIKLALFSIPDEKAPGPDGYSANFFKKAWNIVGTLVSEAVKEFFETGCLLKQMNTTILTMIPKKEQAQNVSDFRPIACCNMIYKVISKILANRLAPVLDTIVDKAQSAFVKGRLISDNIHLAEQLLRQYERKYVSPRCLLKIDLRKAYDSVDWDFLYDVMRGLQFPDTFCAWVKECISTPAFSISLNGEVRGFFPGMKGLRQGDPLSPYLFVLCIEYLSRMVKQRTGNSGFKYHPKCRKQNITHLAFADDLMLMARGDVGSVQILANILTEYGEVSGLHASNLKSSLFLAGVQGMERATIEQLLEFNVGDFPFRYLGVPLAARSLKITEYGPLLEKIGDLIKSWSSLRLSYAGRLQLIQSVVQGVVCYWMSIFSLPTGVIERIEGMSRKFLWGANKGRVAWSTVCLPKLEGGLGLRDLKAWNKALLVKTLWNIHLKKDTLWVRWVNGFFLRNQSIWDWEPKPDSAPLFKSLARIRDEMVQKEGTVQATITKLEKWSTHKGIQVGQVYEWLRPRATPRPCFRAIWNTICEPKHAFIVWLATLERLPTKDRFRPPISVMTCEFCKQENESHMHLFFSCSVVRGIWNSIRGWLNINRYINTMRSGLKWATKEVRGTSWLSRARRIAFHSMVYFTWMMRNKVLKENIEMDAPRLALTIQHYIFQCLYAKFPEYERVWCNGE